MFLEDLPMRQRLVKSPYLSLTFSSSSKLEESSLKKPSSTSSGHDLLELLLLVPEAVLLLVVAHAIVVPLGVVILVGGVELLPLGAIDDEVGGVTALEANPR
jgi:hypothetical protein